jgi:membrane protease YdiL (CAAX protease family)
MSENLLPVLEPPIEELRERKPSGEKALRWFELALVLSVAFAGSLINSIFLLRTGSGSAVPTGDFRWIWMMAQESVALLLLGYVLHRRGKRIADLGLQWSFGNVGRGVLVAVTGYIVYWAGDMLLYVAHRAIMHGAAARPISKIQLFGHASWIMFAAMLLNPFFEELIVRAYLMTEVRELSGSGTLAIVLSWALQTSYHLYYGWLGALAVGFLFLTFSLYYAKARRATPVIVAHGILDLLALFPLR